jgi:hypothetical protein
MANMMLGKDFSVVTPYFLTDSGSFAVAADTLFTTHTPVPAGHDSFEPGMVLEQFRSRLPEFGIDEARFRGLRARFVPDAAPDPFAVLGASPDMPLNEIRALWRRLVRDSHPDVMIARGLPEEAVRMAEKRLIDINRAWDDISAGTSA